MGKNLKFYIYIIPAIRRISDDIIEILNIFLSYNRNNSLLFNRSLIVRNLIIKIIRRFLNFVLIEYMHILYVLVVVEGINEGSLFLLTTNIIER